LAILLLLLTTATMSRAAAPEPAFLVKSTFGFSGGIPQGLTAVGDTLYFYINGAPWQSDGTTNGTVPVTIPGITDLLVNVTIPDQLGENLIFFGSPAGIGNTIVGYAARPVQNLYCVSAANDCPLILSTRTAAAMIACVAAVRLCPSL
jgi:hypothetical protein